ncbi:iron-siderophore ABC transporter substrate-binding protein [Paenibacillus sp. CGMCC 1.16610]|uniref:ABC transporter substrate-binding protein n=1 Tax=Paenibacillus anseongense TaxID=2682845 RepID=A0ABW9UDT4_9BACL|nr:MULTISPECIES: iron-siderophore ABC transporter substrate-binding protein [Paenibacillus]MBA2942837.1 iron-siderophore ABC transporter substrate-binding protein [Paenibacillus sp. CGMCC 1.16610]MVQ38322.1 ABC transporter substrate-binding protein [Paenibacillus anseongense]
MRALQIVLALVLTFALSACGTSATTTKESASSPAAPAATAGEKTIKHAMGTVTLKKKPERVVVLFNGMTDITAHLGVKPVGSVQSWEEKPWYNYLRAKMDGVKDLGEETQPNVEAIIALKPDLIIGTKARHEKLYPQLNSIAPTIITEEIFDWKANLKYASDALYMKEEGDKILADWDKKVAEFKQKAGDKLAKTEVSIVRFERDGSARFYATGFAGTIFKELGLARPKAQILEPGKAVLNLTTKEQMPSLDGDYIFDITRLNAEEPAVEKSQNDWTAHPLWKNLKGVKNGKYFKVDAITWNLAGGSMAAQAMLADLYKYFDIK